MIDIERLELLPQKVSIREGRNYYWRWYRDWNRRNKNLPRVNFIKFVGHEFDKIYSKYKHRLPANEQTVENFCSVTGIVKAIHVDGILCSSSRWGFLPIEKDYYGKSRKWVIYIDPIDGILKKIRSKRFTTNKTTQTAKDYYEWESAKRKRKREQKRAYRKTIYCMKTQEELWDKLRSNQTVPSITLLS